MSPRAAWRLESLGFHNVYDYKPGKLDWMAAGLPTEGAHTSKPRAGELATKDVPTCTMDEKLVDVRERVKDAVVVVNEHNIVMGILRSKELQQDGTLTIENAMHPGPSTFRPYVTAAEMAEFMVRHELECSPITTSDGKLVGLLYRADAMRAAAEGGA
jgi:Mg/Co/Ni transporter MgtE